MVKAIIQRRTGFFKSYFFLCLDFGYVNAMHQDQLSGFKHCIFFILLIASRVFEKKIFFLLNRMTEVSRYIYRYSFFAGLT